MAFDLRFVAPFRKGPIRGTLEMCQGYEYYGMMISCRGRWWKVNDAKGNSH